MHETIEISNSLFTKRAILVKSVLKPCGNFENLCFKVDLEISSHLFEVPRIYFIGISDLWQTLKYVRI
jgi:hypothetical protein